MTGGHRVVSADIARVPCMRRWIFGIHVKESDQADEEAKVRRLLERPNSIPWKFVMA